MTSSGPNRRSPARFNDRRYGSNHPLGAMDFDLQRDSGEKGRTTYREDEWHWEERLRTGPLEEHRTEGWRRPRLPNLTRTQKHSPPGGLDDRQRKHGFELNYAERRRLSPRRWLHSPETSSSRKRTEDHDDFQRYQDERGVPEERLAIRHDAKPGRRTSRPGWDRGGHGKDLQEQVWISDRNTRDRTHKERSFVRPGWRKRCAEDAGFQNSQDSQEWSAQRGLRSNTENAPIIVEHDHGISNRGQVKEDARVRQDYGYHHSHDQWHLREGRPRADHRKGFEHKQEDPRARPTQARRKSPGDVRSSPVRDTFRAKRSPIQEISSGRNSSSPSRTRQQEVAQTLEFLTNLALDANGDVDLRQIGSKLSVKNVPPTSNPVTAGGKRDGKEEKVPQRMGHGVPRAAANRSQTQETLTIKVDMGQSAVQHSASLPSDRQLSVDLISVGRQRLDFLPALEHGSGAQGESSHSGTFAQEIITLVHQVKEHYFKGRALTLNERFSSVQNDQLNEDTEKEEKKHKRRLAVDPGDLRHDLERRRQERLEEVKVTIPGVGFPQQRQLPVRMRKASPALPEKSQPVEAWGPQTRVHCTEQIRSAPEPHSPPLASELQQCQRYQLVKTVNEEVHIVQRTEASENKWRFHS
ncbi:hypothetical protein Z043_110361 [Scleropages formosus]|uniref:BCLAF1 and THRAP3 family member 3-like n=1 Tax=Scleropages formosus TaxID=113540 RepID=A0A0P7VC98_SCLFO|nr:hypothetical protein Z043_110361 [Scleropages formosus]